MLSAITARVWAILIGIGVVFLLAAIALHMWQVARTNAARARLSTNQAQAAAQAGTEAVNTVAANGDKAAQTDRTAKDGTDAINAAPAGDSNAAADRAACRMRVYVNSERCRALFGLGAGVVVERRPSR